MAARDVTGDGEPEAGSSLIEIARGVEAVEGTEYRLKLVLGDSGAVVIDTDADDLAVAQWRYPDMGGVFAGIVHDVGQATLEGVAAQRQHEFAMRLEADIASVPLRVAADFVQQGGEVGRLGCLALMVAGKIQIILKHALHLAHIGAQFLHLRRVAKHGELKLEAGERRSQIVADAREHGGALFDLAFYAIAHFDKGMRGTAYFRGALRPEARRIAAHPEAFRRFGQPLDRPDLVSQEENGDGNEHDRGNQHPDDED